MDIDDVPLYIDNYMHDNTVLYPQPDRKIRLEFSDDKCYENFKQMFSLKSFDLYCIQSMTHTKKYNLYKNCKVIETGTIKPDLTLNLKGISTYEHPYILFQCEKIVMDIPENKMIIKLRKEKL